MSDLIKIYFYFLLISLNLFGENYDIRTGTTINDSSALDSYLEKGNAPLSQHDFCKMLTKTDCDVRTKATILKNDLKKYLISLDTDSIRGLKYASKKYWEYALLSNAIYDKKNNLLVKKHTEVNNSGWKLYQFKQSLNGLVVGLYKKGDRYIMAIGGTTANSTMIPIIDTVLDVWTDLTLISETIFKPNQLLSLKNWYKKLPQNIKSNIVAITGHSLGGGLAQYMGLMTGIKTYTFNTAPLPLTYESSKDLNGGYKMEAIKIELENPYYLTTGKGSLSPGNQHGEPKKISRYIYHDTVQGFKYKDNITNIMTKNDPLTGILKYTEYVEQSGNIANIIIKTSILDGLKQKLGIQKKHPLVNLIVGKRVNLPLKTSHSMPRISVFMKVTKELLEKGIYVISDNENGKYYIYHLADNAENKILTFHTSDEPLAFNNISTKKDWVYKYILKMQEYGMDLNGDGKGDFNKSAPRTQGEVLKIISKLFYKKNNLAGNGFNKYYNFLAKKKKGSIRLIPSNFSINTLNSEVTRGDIANILVAFLSLENKIKKADSNRARENIDVSKGWYKESALLDVLNIAHGQNGNFGWNNNVTQAESLKFFVKTYEYYMEH